MTDTQMIYEMIQNSIASDRLDEAIRMISALSQDAQQGFLQAVAGVPVNLSSLPAAVKLESEGLVMLGGFCGALVCCGGISYLLSGSKDDAKEKHDWNSFAEECASCCSRNWSVSHYKLIDSYCEWCGMNCS